MVNDKLNDTIKEISEKDAKYLLQVIRLYEQTFEHEVREPFALFAKSLHLAKDAFPHAFHLLVVVAKDQVIGFVSGHYLADVNVGFVVYLAIDPSWQSHGIGAQLLASLEQKFEQDARLASYDGLSAIVLETEREDEAKSAIEVKQAHRRQHFFRRQGFDRRDDVKYHQPPLHVGDKDVPLHLWTKNRANNPIDYAQLIAIIALIYREKYQKINGIDQKLLHAMMQQHKDQQKPTS
jgi:ribosomal protein S18 acetylase RimI-like enzyme